MFENQGILYPNNPAPHRAHAIMFKSAEVHNILCALAQAVDALLIIIKQNIASDMQFIIVWIDYMVFS